MQFELNHLQFMSNLFQRFVSAMAGSLADFAPDRPTNLQFFVMSCVRTWESF